jgi:hypothetical protein
MAGFHYSKRDFVPVHISIWVQMIEHWKLNGDFSAFRLFKNMYDRIPNHKLLINWAMEVILEVQYNLGLKPHRDLMDLELVQFVIVGKGSPTGRLPVNAFTGDAPEKIRHRVRLAKTALTTIREKFEEENLSAAIFGTFMSGHVHCYHPQTGAFLTTIDVSSLNPL